MPGIQWYHFQPPSMTPNLRCGPPLLELWRLPTYYYDFLVLSIMRPSSVVNGATVANW